MMVLILRKVRPGLKGYLTRWLTQPQSGVFIGHASARIRDKLWEHVCHEIDSRDGSAVLIHPADNEQGYLLRTHGDSPRIVRDFDGLLLPKTPLSSS